MVQVHGATTKCRKNYMEFSLHENANILYDTWELTI